MTNLPSPTPPAIATIPGLQDSLGKRPDTNWVKTKIPSSSGSISAITADSGLAGGGNSGTVSLKVKYGGTGTAATVSRSDHTHTGLTDANISSLSYSKLSGAPTIPTVPSSLPPNGTAGGSLSGTYPTPKIASNAISDTNISTNANIAGGKINPDFGTKSIVTSSNITLRSSDNQPQMGLIVEPNVFEIYSIRGGARSSECFHIQNLSASTNDNFGEFYGSLDIGKSITAQTCCSSSDKRFKKNITGITNALQLTDSLQGVYYDWRCNEFPERSFSSNRQIGLIAQDVEKVLPMVVNQDNEGYKSISYDKISALLIEAIKEQQTIIKSQDDRIKKLEQEMATLKDSKQ